MFSIDFFKTMFLLTITLLSLCHISYAPPVSKTQSNEADVNGLEDYMEYHRYLREVVNALESDPKFRDKLEKADEKDIRSGKIAEELEFVSHHVRNQLDEIKRVELQRLKELTERKMRLQQNIDLDDPTHKHLDHKNPHTFEIEDLKKLIAKTTADLVEADQKRKEDFKEYELNKEYEKQVKINHTNGEVREKLEQEYKEREEKHRKHEKLHEPGHKAQLEEVWQEQDEMQQEFNPKTFFMLHDIDSNGLWDQEEVKALFVKELEKMYAAGQPEDDMRERAEEMERMRESVFKEVDLNRDGFIDFQEFLAQTKRNDFQQDHGWQGLDERKPYTDQELEQYIRQHQMANQIPHGYPYPGQMQPPMYQPPPYGQQPQFHPGQVPQQHPQQLQGHLNSNEVYPQQHHGNQPPQPVYHQQNFQPQGQQAHYNPPPQQNYQQQNRQAPPQPQQNYQVPPQQQQIPHSQQQNHQLPQQVPPQAQQVPPQAQQVPPQAQQVPPQVNQQPQVASNEQNKAAPPPALPQNPNVNKV